MFKDISVELLDCMGDDLTTVNAARVSFAKTKSDLDEKDAKLTAYLAEHNHWSPFAHAQLQFRITAPIFVARQWFKHIVGFARNEESRRYVSTVPTFYLPEVFHHVPGGSIKQGSGAVRHDSGLISTMVAEQYGAATKLYNDLIADGVAPEEARMVLPQGMMTSWVETGSLMAYTRACKLRLDSHAQRATRDLAEQLAVEVAKRFPVGWSALMGVEGDV